MSSDFEGEVKDFAMVVPVPVVLKKEQVKVIESSLFRKFDDYSGPRLASYYDEDPCQPPYVYTWGGMASGGTTYTTIVTDSNGASANYQVKIEAKYSVGEYDILVLSAQESSGLERWLIDNGYKIPEGAKEVLDPYIKSNLKFFVVKANTDEMKRLGTDKLRPIQISFNSPKFMLPIRLGMANATSAQDMIIYAFTKSGRIETTNYSTVKMPTNKNVPLFVKDKFGKFYKSVFTRSYKRNGKKSVFLEYAWDISGAVTQFCDPCVGDPPMLQDLANAGVDWVQQYHGGYEGNVFFTRLHVSYDRANFPQDLQFQETPNKENYQARYVIHYPPDSKFDCKKSNSYLVELQRRRQEELNNLVALTGWDVAQYANYPSEYNKHIKAGEQHNVKGSSIIPMGENGSENFGTLLLCLISLGAVIFTLTRRPAVKKS
ncbi:MAG: hypothetical protein FD123_3664 [Bacteroidetes bacterium]|nr:MAG: hypothetical protein FD123_3664 [Bacteroidota bacterium]